MTGPDDLRRSMRVGDVQLLVPACWICPSRSADGTLQDGSVNVEL